MFAPHAGRLTRRTMLQVGGLSTLGLTLGGFLRRAAAGEVAAGAKAKSAIVVYLGGGPPHLDTFDLKPEAPDDIRGEFKPIDTNVSGVRICEHLPRLARSADKFAVVNGITHTLAGHELGRLYLNTGNRPLPSLEFPGYGAVVSREKPGVPELPHFVGIPNTPQSAGYLGVRYAPLQTNSVPKPGLPFSVRGISLGNGETIAQFEQRQRLLDKLDTAFASVEGQHPLVDGLERFDRQAYAVIGSPKAREAFDTSLEKPETAAAFGAHGFGQSCLLAVRLVEAGVRFATVTFNGWDTHSGNFKACRENLLPQLDDGLAALVGSLADRGLLESTLVLVYGEFGRTPKINPRAGRDHWPRAMFALFAGGGVRAGQVLGASDDKGMGPAGDGFAPDQVAASFYAGLGIDFRKEYHTNTGRPVMIVRDGSLIPGLFA